MKNTNLQELSVGELVDRFVEIGLAQDEAVLYDETAKFNRLFKQMQDVVQELGRRPGDARRALLSLYDHSNLQVRLKAVKNSLALAPEEGRRILQAIADSHDYPYAGEAGMSLWAIDEGIFKPT